MQRLILASQSPRRSELLKQAGYLFTVTSVQISEIPDENLNLPQQIEQLAVDKALACLNSGKVLKQQGNLLLSADTVVALAGQILGKPKDRKENRQFLCQLSGQTHQVITGVCLIEVDTRKQIVAHDLSEIIFRDLSPEEIEGYVNSDEGLDKAGGYGIQGPAGKFVKSVSGAIDNVIGLPVKLVEKLLAENSWQIERLSGE
jgi:septum formation protein